MQRNQRRVCSVSTPRMSVGGALTILPRCRGRPFLVQMTSGRLIIDPLPRPDFDDASLRRPFWIPAGARATWRASTPSEEVSMSNDLETRALAFAEQAHASIDQRRKPTGE